MIEHIHKFGIPKSTMHHALINRFELTQEQIEACEKYYILRWTGAHFKHVMHSGVIRHQNTEYLVVYKDCKPSEIATSSQLFMSFRKPAHEFHLQAYVLVSIGF